LGGQDDPPSILVRRDGLEGLGLIMRFTQVLRTNDPVLISFVTAYLKAHGVETLVLDNHASGIDGSIGAIPRRLVVASDVVIKTRHLLNEADIDHDL